MTHLERTAYHEAGHAVAAWGLRVPIKSVTIKEGSQDPRFPIDGVTVRGDVSLVHNPLSGRLWRTHGLYFLCILFAGGIAEHIATGKRLNKRSNWARFAGDIMSIKTIVNLFWKTQDKAFAALKNLSDCARDLLHEHWQLVQTLARALLEKQTMSGRAVRRLLNDVAKRQGVKEGDVKVYGRSSARSSLSRRESHGSL